MVNVVPVSHNIVFFFLLPIESLSLPAEELIQNDDPTEDKNKE